MLTEGAVRASDKRARFIALEAYVEAGETILRDLFQQDDGGWLQDATLLDLMVADRLAEEADKVRAEGWKWVEAASDFPYGHTWSMRRLRGTPVEMTERARPTRSPARRIRGSRSRIRRARRIAQGNRGAHRRAQCGPGGA